MKQCVYWIHFQSDRGLAEKVDSVGRNDREAAIVADKWKERDS